MVASLATVFLVYRCADLLGRDPLTAAVIIGINPIVLVWGLGGDHNDFLMIFFLVLGFWLLLARQLDADRQARTAAAARPGDRGSKRTCAALWAWLDGMPRPLVVGEPAAWMEIGAGVALVAAVAIKASSAVLVPIVVAGAARRIRVATGVVIGLVAASAMTVIAFGVNLPNIGQQDGLVIPTGIPNLIGLALGFGGYTSQMRTVFTLLLAAVVAGAVVWVWRTRRWLTACGVATFVLLLTLGWTLPWYILWLLPFAALSRSPRPEGRRPCCSASTSTSPGCPTRPRCSGSCTSTRRRRISGPGDQLHEQPAVLMADRTTPASSGDDSRRRIATSRPGPRIRTVPVRAATPDPRESLSGLAESTHLDG